MNFVIISYNFPPKSDAESFCTARFASALARSGNNVHVVTMDHSSDMPQSTYDFLVDGSIRITRIPLTKKCCNNWCRLRYLTTEWGSRDYNIAIELLGQVLSGYDKPILISRSNPESSHIIAFRARKFAYKWIAHFSDPIPFGGAACDLKSLIWRSMTVRWMRKVLTSCDGVSLTCDEVIRFYHEFYGALFDRLPHFINHHIGEPQLPSDVKWTSPYKEPIIVHAGMINPERGAKDMVRALESLNCNGCKCRFIQVGECGDATKEILTERDDIEIMRSTHPGFGASVVEAANVVFIPDVQVDLPYTPFMPSKFVYQIFTDKPLLLYTREGSPMHNYYMRYPNSGLYYADYTRPETLVAAIRSALSGGNFGLQRESLRSDFTQTAVAGSFNNKMRSLYGM